MNGQEIIEMARQSGLHFLVEPNWMFHEQLEAFAKLVAAKEREACADLCATYYDPMYAEYDEAGNELAEAIRARGEA